MQAIWEMRIGNFLCVLSKVRAEYDKVGEAMEGIAKGFMAAEASSSPVDYAIQDEASGVILLEARHVNLDGGDAA